MIIYWDKKTNSKNRIGQRVKELRKAHNLTQKTLAALFNLQDMILMIWQSCELNKAHVSFPTTKLSHWPKYLMFPANIFLV